MVEVAADRSRDPAVIETVPAIAREVLARFEVDPSQARRAEGWTNATWLTDALAVRVALSQGSTTFAREVALVSILPEEVGYPAIVASGVMDGYEWVLTRRVPGENLGTLWPNLSWAERATAATWLWRRAQVVHGVDLTVARRVASTRSPLYARDADEAGQRLARLVEAGILTRAERRALESLLHGFWPVLDDAPVVLNHGDLCTENALWRDGRVTALFDFEFAVVAPVVVDLVELVKIAYAPHEHGDVTPDTAGLDRTLLQDVVAAIATAEVTMPEGPVLMIGHAVLLELWLLESYYQHDGSSGFRNWAPYRTLMPFAHGESTYLQPVLESLII
jgi:scyllo-inosamine 4-kinase